MVQGSNELAPQILCMSWRPVGPKGMMRDGRTVMVNCESESIENSRGIPCKEVVAMAPLRDLM